MRWAWLIGAILLAAAAAGVFWAAQDPKWFVGLVAASIASLGRAVWPLLRRYTPKERAEMRRRIREGWSKEGGR